MRFLCGSTCRPACFHLKIFRRIQENITSYIGASFPYVRRKKLNVCFSQYANTSTIPLYSTAELINHRADLSIVFQSILNDHVLIAKAPTYGVKKEGHTIPIA
ncbi:hypothetical protein TNCT_309771 [Trichonephila clavata]|uniref:Uncharacterized protein n=1 Tax=Trichonephila clavata TaxID=2740835 RepID=A0A8X6J028_TRICU|nr:hypothetical protein TNCT_309771 [Trichonephila clavata]